MGKPKKSNPVLLIQEDDVENIVISQPETKTRKKKAMSSAKASFVKKSGHSNEDDFSALIGGEKIKGTGKGDVLKNGHKFSLKQICARIQFALYGKNSKNWVETSPSALKCKSILSIYPNSFAEYQKNKTHYKTLLREKMVDFKDHLSIKDNLKEYLSLVITNFGDVNYVVMKDDTNQFIFDANEVIDTIVSNGIIANSRAIKNGDTPEQKVLITIPQGKRFVNLIELETRNSSEGHYAEFLCVCNAKKLFNLLTTSITEEKIFNDNLVVRGKAIKDFQEKILD
jgi:hypothetical protein